LGYRGESSGGKSTRIFYFLNPSHSSPNLLETKPFHPKYLTQKQQTHLRQLQP